MKRDLIREYLSFLQVEKISGEKLCRKLRERFGDKCLISNEQNHIIGL
jgi:hypothetical protein